MTSDSEEGYSLKHKQFTKKTSLATDSQQHPEQVGKVRNKCGQKV